MGAAHTHAHTRHHFILETEQLQIWGPVRDPGTDAPPTPGDGRAHRNPFTCSFAGGHLGRVHLSAVIDESVVDVCVQVSVRTCGLFSAGYVPRSELLGHPVTQSGTSRGTACVRRLCHLSQPTATSPGPHVPASLQIPVSLLFVFHRVHSSRQEV